MVTCSDWLGFLNHLLAKKSVITVIGTDLLGSISEAEHGANFSRSHGVGGRENKVRAVLGNKKRGMDAGSTQQGVAQVFGANLQRKNQDLGKSNGCPRSHS